MTSSSSSPGRTPVDGFDAASVPSAALIEFAGRQRWFAGRSEPVAGARFEPIAGSIGAAELGELVVAIEDGEAQRYFLPLVAAPEGAAAHSLDAGPAGGLLADAARDPAFAAAVVACLAKGGEGEGALVVHRSQAAAERLAAVAGVPASEIKVLSGEQSNTSVGIGRLGILKFYRRLRDGEQPELEVTAFLTEKTGFTGAPALYGSLELRRPDGSHAAVAALFERVANRGDAWAVVTDDLVAALSGAPAPAETFDAGRTLGRRTGEMHAALATRTGDPAFDPEALDAASLQKIVAEARHEAGEALDVLAREAERSPELKGEIDRLLAARAEIDGWFAGFTAVPSGGWRTRIHGDYHLGQVLVSGEDAVILDFEGEPGRPLNERRAKTSPLRDVAGMLRSFDYAAFAARDRLGAEAGEAAREAADAWAARTSADFLKAWEAASGVSLVDEANRRLLDLFVLQKAFYELRYEAAMRPAWLSIPLRGIVSLLEKRQVVR
ncbi:phosphotransferase [Aureimonas sp. SK2]|uniref:phosphotransferase n=1 Tax=Aureimonas sp. SK2 TaxID=3015992 RepID=UPI002444DA5D|nr:phosphotransferase [Aureimonas sp. SK2]